MTDANALEGLFRAEVAADLDLLAALHDRELDGETLTALVQTGFPAGLALDVAQGLGDWSLDRIGQLISALAAAATPETLDELAAGYAEVYLLHGLGASPSESPWVDEDGLQRQEPMLQTRRWFGRHGLKIADDSKRPDDHIVYSLMFVAHLLRTVPGDSGLAEAHAFLTQHPQKWCGQFAARIESRGGPPFYCALAAVTATYIDALVVALSAFQSEAAQLFQPDLPELPTFATPCSPGHAP